jgi:hypothetical protein
MQLLLITPVHLTDKILDYDGRVKTIEIRLDCRWLQRCFLIWNYYVGCLWAPLLFLTQSKETVFWLNLMFFTIKQDSDNIIHSWIWEKSHFNDECLVLFGPIISRFFACSNEEKRGACSSPVLSLWYKHSSLLLKSQDRFIARAKWRELLFFLFPKSVKL